MDHLSNVKLIIIGDGIFWDPETILSLPQDGYEINDSIFLCDEKKSASPIQAIPFSAYDGFAIKDILADTLKIQSAVILQSSAFKEIIHHRCRDLKIPFCSTNVSHKLRFIAQLKHSYALRQIVILDDHLTPSDFPEEQPRFLYSRHHFKGITKHLIRAFTNTYVDENMDAPSGETRIPPNCKNIHSGKKQIRALICDIDGTCTDGFKIYGEDGSEWKRFSLADMRALKNWNDSGRLSFLITGESGSIPQKFAAQCHIPEAHLSMNAGSKKVQILYEICRKFTLKPEEIAYIGDDGNDCGTIEYLIGKNGLAACPANAMPSIGNIPHILQLENEGGHEAIAELIAIIDGS
jgi:YrbI family 3-deoxy-D-manno-octulosonate 8-phosphate phosphatase